MKKVYFLLFTCLFSLQLVGQIRSNFNSTNRKVGLYNNTYKNAYSANISYGILEFKGDLDEKTDERSTTTNLTINKRVSAGMSLTTKVSIGHLYGKGDTYNYSYDFSESRESEFSNSFLAYSFLVKKQLIKQKESNMNMLRINLAAGLGVISSKVKLHSENFYWPDTQDNFKTVFIPITLDFEYYLTPYFGFNLAAELNYCFSDRLDLYEGGKVGLNDSPKIEYFTGYTAGISFKID